MPCVSLTRNTMEGVPSAAKFKHEPLPDSTTHIRLLEIQGIDAYDHVVCLLKAWPVEQAPDYYALSYVSHTHTQHVQHTDRSPAVSATPGAHLIQVMKLLSMNASSWQAETASMRSDRRIHRRPADISGWTLFALTKAPHKRRVIKWV
jgi:hypothetical protein